MPESSRTIARKAGSAGLEKALQSLMPALLQRLDRLDESIGAIDREFHGLREHIDDRYDQLREVMNELGQRMARVEGTIDTFTRSVERQSDKMDKWIERLVRVEMTQGVRRRGKRAS